MMVQRLSKMLVVVGLMVAPLSGAAWAQQEGDKIEYRVQKRPEKWMPGVFIKVVPNGLQALIHETPTEFFPEGFERVYDLTEIRPLAAPVAVPATPNQPGMPADPNGPAILPMPEPMPEAPADLPGAAPVANAPAPAALTFEPGEQLEYRAVKWPEKWEVGTVVRRIPNGKQVLIREKPTEFNPDGFERAYDFAELRPLKTPGGGDQAASCGDEMSGDTQAPPTAAAGGPMSQEDVLSFLRTRFAGVDPFRHPKREEILEQLRVEALRRGVSFRNETLGAFSNELGKFGALSNVRAALTDNFGAPARLQDLYGEWALFKVGIAIPKEKNGRIAPGREFFGDGGGIIINPDRTYVWHATATPIKGSWRPATPDELAKSDKGGEGIVVLNGKGTWSWLIFKRDEGGPEGTGIKVVDLDTRNLRERGTRR